MKARLLSPGRARAPLLIAAALVLCLAVGSGAGNLTIHCLNVGQGDCTLIISPTGGTLLFDAGENGKGNQVVIPYLQTYGLDALDYICASHYHSDHIGGIDEVVAYLGIDSIRVAVLDRGWSYVTPTYSDYEAAVSSKRATIYDGQIMDLGGGVTVRCLGVNGNGVLSPPFDTQYDENDLSVILLVQYEDFQFFVAGDLPGVNNSYYNDIETSISAEVSGVDVYQADHHGSSSSSNQKLISSLLPTVSVISVGDGNPYGHPHQQTIDRLVYYGSYIYQTELGSGGSIPSGHGEVVSGHVVIEVDSTFYTVDQTDIYDMGGSSTPISAVNEDDANGEPVMLYEPVIIRGVATVATGTFSGVHNDIFIQDATGGVNVFKRNSLVPTVEVGDSVKVSGMVDQYRGLTRITSPAIYLEALGVGEPAPVLVTTNEIETNGEAYEGLFVKALSCSITGGTWPAEGSNGTVTIDDGSGECTMFIDSDTDIDGTTQPGERTDIVGIVTQEDLSFPYLSNHRLTPRSIQDILPGAGIRLPVAENDVIASIHPNPSSGTLRLVFGRQVTDLVKHIALYDVTGREIFRTQAPAGSRSFDWNATDSMGHGLPSGVYFAVVRAGDKEATAKVVVLK